MHSKPKGKNLTCGGDGTTTVNLGRSENVRPALHSSSSSIGQRNESTMML